MHWKVPACRNTAYQLLLPGYGYKYKTRERTRLRYQLEDSVEQILQNLWCIRIKQRQEELILHGQMITLGTL